MKNQNQKSNTAAKTKRKPSAAGKHTNYAVKVLLSAKNGLTNRIRIATTQMQEAADERSKQTAKRRLNKQRSLMKEVNDFLKLAKSGELSMG